MGDIHIDTTVDDIVNVFVLSLVLEVVVDVACFLWERNRLNFGKVFRAWTLPRLRLSMASAFFMSLTYGLLQFERLQHNDVCAPPKWMTFGWLFLFRLGIAITAAVFVAVLCWRSLSQRETTVQKFVAD